MVLGAALAFAGLLGGMAVNEYVVHDEAEDREDYTGERDDVKHSLEAVCTDLAVVSIQAEAFLGELQTGGSQTETTVYPVRSAYLCPAVGLHKQ